MIDTADKTLRLDPIRTGRHPRIRLLIVDDNRSVLRSLDGVLRDEGYLVDTAASAEEGLRLVDRTTYDAIFLDVWLPAMDGIDALKRIRTRRPRQYVIMISGHGTIETAVQATKLGAYDFIEKPLARDQVLLVLDHALKQKRLETENRSLKDLIRQGDGHDRHLGSDAGAPPADRIRGPHRGKGGHLRRERHRQRTGGAVAPPQQRAPRGALRRSQLRRPYRMT